MAKRSRMSMLKRQRELRKAEKAAQKRAKRHGPHEGGLVEPRPTVRFSDPEHPDETDAPNEPDEPTTEPKTEGIQPT